MLSYSTEPILVVMSGIPLSGKDTLLTYLSVNNFEIISRDNILNELGSYNSYRAQYKFVDSKLVDKVFFQKIIFFSEQQKNVIINATNLTLKRRRKILGRFPNYFTIIIQMPLLSYEEFIKRNNTRKKEIGKALPVSLYKEMLAFYEPIEKNEGWDLVICI